MPLIPKREIQKLSWWSGLHIALLLSLPLFALLILPRGFEPVWWWLLVALFFAGFAVFASWMPSVQINLLVVFAFWSMFLILEPSFAVRSIAFVILAAVIHGLFQVALVLIFTKTPKR